MSYKILRAIEMSLSPESIDNAIREIKELKADLEYMLEKLVYALLEEGKSIARMQIVSMDAVDTGLLEHSIQTTGYDPDKHMGEIYTNNPYAVYVEYGTGPIGQESPHPEASLAGWEYDVGPTIHERIVRWRDHSTNTDFFINLGRGWWYPGRDGQWHWTSGQPSRAFMYNTLLTLEEEAPKIASKMIAQM